MKVIIAGSRSINDYEALKKCWLASPFKDAVTEIISGCAIGVDTLGIQLASELNVPCIQMPANWKQYGRGAGFIRNAKMVTIADAAVILWDGKSSGTNHTIELMKNLNKPFYSEVLTTT